jgi:hypothetical protein
MKTLDQLSNQLDTLVNARERRIPISSVPFTITHTGSYYLTSSVTFSATTGDAIAINASDVSLDLMGFTLSSAAGVTGSGIRVGNGFRNICVKNGAITGTTVVSISGLPPNRTWSAAPGGFARGIDASASARNCEFRQLRVSGCRFDGLNAADGTIVEDVTATDNGSVGIVAGAASVSHCSATQNHFRGILASSGTVTNSSAANNGDDGGISAHAISNCAAFTNGGVGLAGNTVTGSSSNSNDIDGISALQGTVTNCAAKGNGGDGIAAANGVVAFCIAVNNNGKNNGSTNIDAVGATRTGNNPTP